MYRCAQIQITFLFSVAAVAMVAGREADGDGWAINASGNPIVVLERQRGDLLATLHCHPAVGTWLQLAEVQEELGRAYAWEVEEALGARGWGQGASGTAETADKTADKSTAGAAAPTTAGTAVPPAPSTLKPQPPDWSLLERRTLEVLRCYDGYIEALEKAGELARRRIQEEGDLRPDLVEKYRRLLTELGPVLAQARANRPVVEAARRVRLRVIGACRRFYAQPSPANARDCLQAFVLGLDRPQGLSPPMLERLDEPTRRMVELAGLPVGRLSAAQALALARWYNDLARSARIDARDHGLVRAWLYVAVARTNRAATSRSRPRKETVGASHVVGTGPLPDPEVHRDGSSIRDGGSEDLTHPTQTGRSDRAEVRELAVSVAGQLHGLGWSDAQIAQAAAEVRLQLGQTTAGIPTPIGMPPAPPETTAGTAGPPQTTGWAVHQPSEPSQSAVAAAPPPSPAAAHATQPHANPPARVTDTGWRICAKCGQPFFAGWGSPRPRKLCDKCSGSHSGGGGQHSIFDFGRK